MTKKSKIAFIVVDLQNDFCPGGALPVADGDKIVPLVNIQVARARRAGHVVAASRDWHPRQTKHFKEFGGIWPVHCVQGTRGAEFHPDFDIRDIPVFSKGTGTEDDGYSAYDGRSESGQTLLEFLQEKEVEEVCLKGLATDYCVKATALDARKHGFKTVVLLDACRAVNLHPDDEAKAIKEMRDAGVLFSSVWVG